MSNVIESTDLQLAGSGYRARKDRAFEPGEYRQLKNVELYRGSIRTMPNVEAFNSTTTMTQRASALGIMGEGGGYVVAASYTEQWTATDTGYITMWAPTSLPITGPSPNIASWHRIVHFYKYNDTYYWITLEYIANASPSLVGTYRFHIYYMDASNAISSAFGTLSTAILFDFVPPNNQNLLVRDVFVQGERLWIVTSERLFFSAATDHTNFAAPSGGFFDFERDNFTAGTFYRDSIYLLAEDGCYVITYNTDPNVDAVSVQVSNDVGGHSIVVHDDTVYFANLQGLYSVVSNNVDLAFKFEFYDHIQTTPRIDIVSHNEYLFITHYTEESFNNKPEGDFGRYWRLFRQQYQPGYGFEDCATFVLNMEEGSLFQFDYWDHRDSANEGRPTQFISHPYQGQRRLVFLCATFALSSNNENHLYKFALPDSFNNRYGFDHAIDNNDEVQIYNKPIVVEIENWRPEGTDFMVKKFRSLSLLAELPESLFQVSFAFDNKPYGDPVPLSSLITDDYPPEYLENRTPAPAFRVPIMQKARSLSIKFEAVDVDLPTVGYLFNKFSLSGAQITWTLGKRLPVTR